MDNTTLELIQGYITKAKEKLKVAEKLFADGDFEDAVSRAYYAVFHITQAALLSEGLTADTHQGLVNVFGLHFIKTGKLPKKLGRYLSNLKDDCENSDYEIFSSVDKESAELSIKEANEFFKEIESYLQNVLTTQDALTSMK